MSDVIPPNYDALVNILQQQVRISAAILRVLQGGLTISQAATSYTVAALPTSAANGAVAFATNGRLPGEGAGAGSGCPVFWHAPTSQWYSTVAGTLILA